MTRLKAGAMSVGDAAELLGVSPRQVRRLRERFAHEGLEAVGHRNRGKTPANRTDPTTVERIAELVREGGKYHDLNVCHLPELLAQHEEIVIGRSTLDRLLKGEGLRQNRREGPRRHRRRRERKEAAGMLVQIDASAHDWLEGRGPKLALHGGIDDATSTVLALHLEPTECQAGYLRLTRTIALAQGADHRGGVGRDCADEPSAAAVFRTGGGVDRGAVPSGEGARPGGAPRLWGALQDRLIKELRLADVRALEEANTFLPSFIKRFNARFAHPPVDPAPAWVPLPDDCDLAYYFATHETRLVGKRVTVHVVPDGDLFVYAGRRRLPFRRRRAGAPGSSEIRRAPRRVRNRPKRRLLTDIVAEQ